jgi:ABC-type transport system substrate-binding protein
LANAFIEHDPGRANELLDSIGLTERDLEGMRTFPDGSSMTFFLDFSPFTGVGPAEFIVDHWAEVGVRVVVRERSRSLFYNQKNARDFDFNIWSAESDFFPVLAAALLRAAEHRSVLGGRLGSVVSAGRVLRLAAKPGDQDFGDEAAA